MINLEEGYSLCPVFRRYSIRISIDFPTVSELCFPQFLHVDYIALPMTAVSILVSHSAYAISLPFHIAVDTALLKPKYKIIG
jgi:hypothetical protein